MYKFYLLSPTVHWNFLFRKLRLAKNENKKNLGPQAQLNRWSVKREKDTEEQVQKPLAVLEGPWEESISVAVPQVRRQREAGERQEVWAK